MAVFLRYLFLLARSTRQCDCEMCTAGPLQGELEGEFGISSRPENLDTGATASVASETSPTTPSSSLPIPPHDPSGAG